MGSTLSNDLANSDLDLRNSIAIQLQGNHYPPVPLSMVDPCIAAINACNDEDYDAEIELPEGVTWRGNTYAPANAIVEAHHLDAWVNHASWCDCDECIYTEDE